MARPRKCKRVCCVPDNRLYGPLGSEGEMPGPRVVMTVEEYEAIRLIDLEDLTQEACAEQMQVARATVQSLYKDARKKLAEFLVSGCHLQIEGGDYQLYNEEEHDHRCGMCQSGQHRRHGKIGHKKGCMR